MKTPTTLKLAVAVVAMSAAGGFLFAPAAYAESVKTCEEPVTPPNNNAGFTETDTQHAQCDSQSKKNLTEGPVTNSQDKVVPGKN
jgi:hypothetical protein